MKTQKVGLLKRLFNIIVKPKCFFSKIVADGKMEDAIIRAFLWGLIGGILNFVLLLFVTGEVFSLWLLIKTIVITPILAVFLLFVLSGLMMLFAELSNGERDWEIVVKSVASLFFVYPLMLICNTLAFSCASLWAVTIIMDLYVLFLFYNIAVYCLHAKKVQVLFVLSVIAILLMCLYMSNYRHFWFIIKNIHASIDCAPIF